MPQRLSDVLSQVMGVRPRPGSPAPAAAAAPAPAPALDQLAVSRATGPIGKLVAGTEPTPAEWLALGQQVAGMNRTELARVTQALTAAGFVPSVLAGGRYATFQSATLTVTVEPATGRLRRTTGNQADVIEGGQITARFTYEDGLIKVQRAQRSEVWTNAGEGQRGGRPITAPQAPWVPGEPPRVAPGIPPRNNFRQPVYRDGEDTVGFLEKVDQAVLRAGGEILVPATAAPADADWHNCFSHALTGGQGDLADPFDRTSMPRWLLQPHFQLNGGRFDQLAPAQRVHPGDLVVYKVPGSDTITHVALVKEVDGDGNPARIESKFGAWGTYRHNPFDVLPAYGVPAGFYRPKT